MEKIGVRLISSIYSPPTKSQLTSGTRYHQAPQKFVVGGWVENDVDGGEDCFVKNDRGGAVIEARYASRWYW